MSAITIPDVTQWEELLQNQNIPKWLLNTIKQFVRLPSILKLLESFPDLEKVEYYKSTASFYADNPTLAFMSQHVNEKATQCEVYLSGGYGKTISVCPYVLANGFTIFSKPKCFNLTDESSEGYEGETRWKKNMQEAKINNTIIEKITAHLDSHRYDRSPESSLCKSAYTNESIEQLKLLLL